MKKKSFPYRSLRRRLRRILLQKDETTNQTYEFVENTELKEFTESLIMHIRDKKPLKLYRYSTSDYYNLRNIEKQQLVLSPVGKLNDIFEGIPNSEEDIINKASGVDLKRLEEIAFLKCFSEDYNNILMWSHYTGESRGFCVEYDLSLLSPNEEIFKYLYPVTYIKKRYLKSNFKYLSSELRSLELDILSNNCSDFENYYWLKDITSLFLVKGESWEYEKEWRIVVTKLETEEKNIFQNHIIPFKCISGIYLGLRINSEIVDHVKEIAIRLNKSFQGSDRPLINVYSSKLHPAEYKLVFSEINLN